MRAECLLWVVGELPLRDRGRGGASKSRRLYGSMRNGFSLYVFLNPLKTKSIQSKTEQNESQYLNNTMWAYFNNNILIAFK